MGNQPNRFKPNIGLPYLLICFALICVIAKALWIIIVQQSYWNRAAKRQKIEVVADKAIRGDIISSDGRIFSSSMPTYTMYLDFMLEYKNKKQQEKKQKEKDAYLYSLSLDTICEGLAKVYRHRSKEYFKKHLIEGRKKNSRNYLIDSKKITYLEKEELYKLPLFNKGKYFGGLKAEETNTRNKPFGNLAARTLGNLYGSLEKGATGGLELYYDSILKGKDGKVIAKRLHAMRGESVTIKIGHERVSKTINGYNIVTTIDVGMQDIAEQAIIEKMKEVNGVAGVVVLMEVKTGDIKALVNITKDQNGNYREIKPHATEDFIDPGSTFKTASLMVAMEDGHITPDYTVDTKNGVAYYHGARLSDHNSHRGGYGVLNVTEILGYSSNVGVANIIEKFYGKEPQKFIDGLKRMGIYDKIDLQLPEIKAPRIKETTNGSFSSSFSKTTLPWMSVGYEMAIPPIYTATFYNSIANDGVRVKPRLVKTVEKDGTIIEEYPVEILNKKICSAKTLRNIQMMLEKVVSEGLGKSVKSDLFKVSGKTGTARLFEKETGGYAGQKNHVSFCGYFPTEKPMYTMIVSIQRYGPNASGGGMAGPVFKNIAEKVYAKTLRLDISQAIDTINNKKPMVKSGNIKDIKRVLDGINIDYKNKTSGLKDTDIVEASNNNEKIELQNRGEKSAINVIGMGAKNAIYILEKNGYRVRIEGRGKVVSQQQIQAGSGNSKGVIHITLK